jgi:hypothetical protein
LVLLLLNPLLLLPPLVLGLPLLLLLVVLPWMRLLLRLLPLLLVPGAPTAAATAGVRAAVCHCCWYLHCCRHRWSLVSELLLLPPLRGKRAVCFDVLCERQ